MYLLNDRARCHGKNCESRDTCERYLQRRTGGPQTPHYENMADGDVCGHYLEAAQSVPVEVFDSHCNYASFAGRVCNKCGRIHDGGLGGMVGGEQVSKAEEKAAEADELRGKLKISECGMAAAVAEGDRIMIDWQEQIRKTCAALKQRNDAEKERDELRKDAENWRNRHEVSK